MIAVGDDHQFKAIDAGDMFRSIQDKAGAHEKLICLQIVHRQKLPWMQEDSIYFSNLAIQQGPFLL